jgi:hypothetical protein
MSLDSSYISDTLSLSSFTDIENYRESDQQLSSDEESSNSLSRLIEIEESSFSGPLVFPKMHSPSQNPNKDSRMTGSSQHMLSSSPPNIPTNPSNYKPVPSIITMPIQGTKSAPPTFKGRSSEVKRFIKQYEKLLAKNNVVLDSEKVEGIKEYCSLNVENFIESSIHYSNPNWEQLKKEILKYYDASKARTRFKPADLISIAHGNARKSCDTLSHWLKYYRDYTTIGGFLK